MSQKKEMVRRSFQKCGISTPVDGSMDSTFNIRGLEDYAVNYPGEAESEEDHFEDESDASGQHGDDEGGAYIGDMEEEY